MALAILAKFRPTKPAGKGSTRISGQMFGVPGWGVGGANGLICTFICLVVPVDLFEGHTKYKHFILSGNKLDSLAPFLLWLPV